MAMRLMSRMRPRSRLSGGLISQRDPEQSEVEQENRAAQCGVRKKMDHLDNREGPLAGLGEVAKGRVREGLEQRLQCEQDEPFLYGCVAKVRSRRGRGLR